MRRFSISLFLFLLVPLCAARPALAASPEIVDIHGQVQGREARVSFTLRNAFRPEMVEALKSGIEISFKTYLRVEKVNRGWFDLQVGEMKFSRSVRYDALSRVYRLNREGREELLPDVQAALKGMSQYDIAVPLSAGTERGQTYRAHVRTRLDRVGLSEPLRSIFFFSALWDVETDWAKGYLSTP